MVKIVIAGVWACIVALVAVYFSIQVATAPPPVEVAKAPPTEVVRGEAITVPFLENGKVKGYFIGRFSFMVDKEKAGAMQMPMTELMTDQLFTLLVGNSMVDLSKSTKLDIDGFKQAIKTGINKRLGSDVINDVLIEQLDFLGKDDIREGGGGKPKLLPAVKIVEGEKAPEGAAPAH
ncbi:hypothetical protein GOZ89_08255 [Agrobacterium vitis]|uniref:Flagellar basal body-associated FliL family protein n=1 Tax=Agrobacterium vitis TaxID=373 RepID=A0A368NWH4_AGRVI|nr:flagellar basal body-associated FliL family protein [Agrobacterium vitis]KAA3506340.1 hypothetical protein DXM22_24055 [Agrobacterium vitis]KAA3520739.1 hypothetical protein DXT89_25050 [Agrobacterium vitis]MCF1476191.1 flagellar basal body-associated FliL family protein [Agrobacterium vitis]MUZ73621.1 hypothetical protein [Agrobacterium vitis]MUZ98487.1 hypothetical protein [Agrobacterium vitis]